MHQVISSGKHNNNLVNALRKDQQNRVRELAIVKSLWVENTDILKNPDCKTTKVLQLIKLGFRIGTLKTGKNDANKPQMNMCAMLSKGCEELI